MTTEDGLWKRYMRTRSIEDRNALCEFYLDLVRTHVRVLARHKRVEEGEISGAALEALVDVVESFDPARGVRFDTYMRHRVRGAMLREIENAGDLPRGQTIAQRRIDRAETDRFTRTGERRRPVTRLMRRVELEEARGAEGADGTAAATAGAMRGGAGLDALADVSRGVEASRVADGLVHGVGEVLLMVIAAVPLEDRQVIVLHFVEGMDDEEIGTVLGKPAGEVKAQRRAIIEELRTGERRVELEKVGTLFDVTA